MKTQNSKESFSVEDYKELVARLKKENAALKSEVRSCRRNLDICERQLRFALHATSSDDDERDSIIADLFDAITDAIKIADKRDNCQDIVSLFMNINLKWTPPN